MSASFYSMLEPQQSVASATSSYNRPNQYQNRNETLDKTTDYPPAINDSINKLTTMYSKINNIHLRLEETLQQVKRLRDKSVGITEESSVYVDQVKTEIRTLLDGFDHLSRQFENVLATLRKQITISTFNLNNTQHHALSVIVSKYTSFIPDTKRKIEFLVGDVKVSIQQLTENLNASRRDLKTELEQINNEQRLVHHEEQLSRDNVILNEIGQNVNEINTMLKTFNTELEAQGEVVTEITETIVQANDVVNEGVDELIQAEKHQKKGKNLKKIMIITGSVLAGVIVIILLGVLL